jgi:hypothetical protein
MVSQVRIGDDLILPIFGIVGAETLLSDPIKIRTSSYLD